LIIGADGKVVREDPAIERQDFTVSTSNKQLNFVQHIESERWKSFSYEELVARDKANLDITWLKVESAAVER